MEDSIIIMTTTEDIVPTDADGAGMAETMNMDAAPERVDFMEMAPGMKNMGLVKSSRLEAMDKLKDTAVAATLRYPVKRTAEAHAEEATEQAGDTTEARVEAGCRKMHAVLGTAAVVAVRMEDAIVNCRPVSDGMVAG